MMRVLFLTLYPPEAASPRCRVHQFIPGLEARGMACTVRSAVSAATWRRYTQPGARPRPLWYHAEEVRRRLGQLLEAPRYDVVAVQKALLSAYLRGLPHLLNLLAKRFVLDIDDAVHLAPPHPLRGLGRAIEDRDQVRRLMARADVTLAGNDWLCGAVREAGGRPVLFPTVVDTDRFTPASPPSDVFRIGWIGNPSTTPHLAAAGIDGSVLEGMEIALMGADPSQVPWPGAEVVPWSLEGEAAFVRSCSVGIMPLPKTEWALGKCALKALQFMACGVPCVATPWGAVRAIIRGGENGCMADTPAEWCAAFAGLQDARRRKRLGAAARRTVEERFALGSAVEQLAGLLETLA